MVTKSYYEILGVSNDANESTIRSAFRKAIREVHPDLNPNRAKSQQRTRELNIAMEVLSDPVKRKRYDEQLLRMGKAKANAEFEQPATTNGSQESKPETEPASKSTEPTPPEVEIDFAGSSTKRQSNSKRSQSKPIGFPPVLGSLAILTGGLSAVSVSILVLWIFFRSDPTGLIAAELQSTTNTNTNSALTSDESAQLTREVESLKSQLAASIKETAKSRSELLSARPDSLTNPSKLATFEVNQAVVLPMTTGTKLFSNRSDKVAVVHGTCFVDQQFSFVQVAMVTPAPLEIEIVEPGIVYAGFQVYGDHVPPTSWVSTDALFTDSAGRLFRVYRVTCADKGLVSIPWAHPQSGAQILVPGKKVAANISGDQ